LGGRAERLDVNSSRPHDEEQWPAEGGRSFGHPDDVLSPHIHALQVFRRAWRGPRHRPTWFKVMRVLAAAVVISALLTVALVLIGSVMMVFD
jgi:hypothetical protein